MNSNKQPYKSQELTKPKKGAIIGLHKGGNSVRKIANILGVPKSTVQDTVKKWKDTGSINNKTRTEWPKQLNDWYLCCLHWIIRDNNHLSIEEVIENFEKITKISISICSMCKYLHEISLFSCITAVKPLVNEWHHQK